MPCLINFFSLKNSVCPIAFNSGLQNQVYLVTNMSGNSRRTKTDLFVVS